MSSETYVSVQRGEQLSFRLAPAGVARSGASANFIRDQYNSSNLDVVMEGDVVRTTVPTNLAAGRGTLVISASRSATASRCEGPSECWVSVGSQWSFLLTVP